MADGLNKTSEPETSILQLADRVGDLERLLYALEMACDSDRIEDDARSALTHLANMAANMACLVKHDLTLLIGAKPAS